MVYCVLKKRTLILVQKISTVLKSLLLSNIISILPSLIFLYFSIILLLIFTLIDYLSFNKMGLTCGNYITMNVKQGIVTT